MRFAGRFMGHVVIVTSLDAVPPGLRANAGAVILTEAEADAIGAGDPVVIAQVRAIVDAHDREFLHQALRKADQ